MQCCVTVQYSTVQYTFCPFLADLSSCISRVLREEKEKENENEEEEEEEEEEGKDSIFSNCYAYLYPYRDKNIPPHFNENFRDIYILMWIKIFILYYNRCRLILVPRAYFYVIKISDLHSKMCSECLLQLH